MLIEQRVIEGLKTIKNELDVLLRYAGQEIEECKLTSKESFIEVDQHLDEIIEAAENKSSTEHIKKLALEAKGYLEDATK